MHNPFADALGMMNADLDDHLGENVRIVPMKVSDFGAVPDPARAAFECIALVHEHDPSSSDIPKINARVPYSEWEVEIRRANIPAMRRIGQHDHIELISRLPAVRLVVNRIDRFDLDTIGMTCGPDGAPDHT
jgi:hypothetical protein